MNKIEKIAVEMKVQEFKRDLHTFTDEELRAITLKVETVLTVERQNRWSMRND